MKFSKLILVALLAVTGFVSCKKDKEDVKVSNGIVGLWEGTYVNDASGNTFFYSFNIKANGVIEEIDNEGSKIGEGTWELDADTNIFTADYAWPSGLDFSVIAAFNDAEHKMVGDWGYEGSVTDGGTWEMTKKN